MKTSGFAQRKLLKILLIGSVLLISQFSSHAATYYTAASGDITDNIWATTTNGTPAALPPLFNGDIIVIDDNITISTIFNSWQSINLTVNLSATITISGQWWLSATSKVYFLNSTARLVSSGPGNSDKVRFGTTQVWSGNDPDLTGPGTLDGSSNGALPVQLLFFKATVAGDQVYLTWATASELTFDYFVVERSIDAKSFIEIGQIKGHGTSQIRNDYQLDDDKPLIGKNYYRLKSVDFDGFNEYFKVVVADYAAEKSFSIAPSPSDGTSVEFFLNFSPDENSKIVVYNSLGMTVGITSATDSNPSLAFNTELRSGIYYAKLLSKNFTSVERFIVK